VLIRSPSGACAFRITALRPRAVSGGPSTGSVPGRRWHPHGDPACQGLRAPVWRCARSRSPLQRVAPSRLGEWPLRKHRPQLARASPPSPQPRGVWPNFY